MQDEISQLRWQIFGTNFAWFVTLERLINGEKTSPHTIQLLLSGCCEATKLLSFQLQTSRNVC